MGIQRQKKQTSLILNLKSESQTNSSTDVVSHTKLAFSFGGHCVSESLHWQLLILLQGICSIIFAPVVTRGLAVFLKQFIIDHHKLFKELYPD